MDEFEVTLKVKKKSEFRAFHEEIGSSKTEDGREIKVLSLLPCRSTVIVFEGNDYVVNTSFILNAVMSKLLGDEPKGEG